MLNTEIAKIFHEIAILLKMKEVQFKPQAYEKAAYSLELLEEDVGTLYSRGGIAALKKISGIGESMADHIEEYFKTKHIKDYETLKKELPVDIEDLTSVEGVGPKMVYKLYKEFGIKTLSQLEKAAHAGKLHGHSGIGEKTEKNILESIAFLKKSHGRFTLGSALPLARSITEKLKKLPGVGLVEYAGSIRRMQETIGDLDILVITKTSESVMDFFISMQEVEKVLERGPTKTTVRLTIGMNADLRVLKPESFGAALQYFTGDKYHNIQIRAIAVKKGYKLNEYGLYKDKKRIAGKTEEDVYKKLGMAWIPPELRTVHGEIEAALKLNGLPKLIGYDDLKGDLQVQTDWTDGEHSIKQMAEAAKKLGLEYIVITDHTKSLAMTRGSDEKKLLRQMKEIDVIQKKVSGIKILKGAEVNVMKDGSLDIEDAVLTQLDVVGASVHSHFNMSENDMTKRIKRAMENPHVDILFHPTGRVIKRRDAYRVDMEILLKTARDTKTVMEIDAYPDRLDLKDEYIRRAVEMGIRMSIDSDAHSMRHFPYLEYGIAQARRGWAVKEDIINTRSWKEMLKLLK